MMVQALEGQTIGVFYMAWGARSEPLVPLKIFRDSYMRWRAGADHRLCILFKGFNDAGNLQAAEDLLKDVPHEAVFVDEREWDIGSYFVGAARTDCDIACFLNTYSEILGHDWLRKITVNLALPGVGLVGCTGSYEAPQHPGIADNKTFPNPHLRSNAFAIRRDYFLKLKPSTPLSDKLSTHLFEHGSASLTRRVVADGFQVLVVGRDGRGFEVNEWAKSKTFRQGTQANLLVGDNRTRDYDVAPLAQKRTLFQMAWGNGSFGRVEIDPALAVDVDRTLVRDVYRILLGRAPHWTEVDMWTAQLRDGLTKEGLIAEIQVSAECKNRQSLDPYVHRLFSIANAQDGNPSHPLRNAHHP